MRDLLSLHKRHDPCAISIVNRSLCIPGGEINDLHGIVDDVYARLVGDDARGPRWARWHPTRTRRRGPTPPSPGDPPCPVIPAARTPAGAAADLGLHRLGVVRIEFLHLDEPCALLRVGLKNAVDDADVKMGVLVQRGTESVDEGHRVGSRRWTGPRTVFAQMLLEDIEEDAQSAVDGFAVVLGVIAQPLGHREDPLAHRQRREVVVDQVRGGLSHAPGGAGGAQTPALAGEGNQEVVTAGRAAGTGKARGEDAVGERVAEFPFHQARYPGASPSPSRARAR